MSETASARHILSAFCEGIGMDIGFGGDAIVPHAITFDMPQPYTNVGSDGQILRGDCRNLFMFCNESLNWIHSAHLLEDFVYDEAEHIVREWRRVLKVGGLLITNCPDQRRFKAHIKVSGQPDNLAHKESDWSLATIKERVVKPTGPWEQVFEMDNFGPYSFLHVVRKV